MEDKRVAIIDRIKYDGPADGKPWLVHKCPSEKFVLGSQLIVNQGQEAQFFRGGAALDLFGPGTHTLQTGNLPILGSLINLPFGGKTPFTAEVYYVNKTARLDMKWGTHSPMLLEDPKYGLIMHVGGYGSIGVTVEDTRLFVSQLIGAAPAGATVDYKLVSSYFNGLLNTSVKSLVAEWMITNKATFLELSANLKQLSEAAQKAISEEYKRYGVEVKSFYIMNLAPQDEEIVILQEQKAKSARDLVDVCPHCGAASPAGRAFCGSCGKRLGMPCPHCGAILAPGVKFCGNCGKPAGKVKCKACGSDVEPGNKFCGNCGAAV
jgi:membrane protease subunit (stomatin/prohibitin family)